MKVTRTAWFNNYQKSIGDFYSLLCCILIFFMGYGETALSQKATDFVRLERSIETGSFNVKRPTGLAFSPEADAFLVIETPVSGKSPSGVSNITLVSQFGDRTTGSVQVKTSINEPVNFAFDTKANRLFAFQPSANNLTTINTGANGIPRPNPKDNIPGDRFNLQDPQGMAVDPENGDVFVLDGVGPRIVRLTPDSAKDLDDIKISEVDLSNTMLVGLKGIAIDPSTGNFHVLSPNEKRLYEISKKGVIVANRDLSEAGLVDPQSMTFAPSGDQTDDPSKMSLYIADIGEEGKLSNGSPSALSALDETGNSQIVELSLTQPVQLAFSGLEQGTLIQTFDTSVYSPPSPDPAGIGYNSVTGRLMISDSEVEEIDGPLPIGQIALFDNATLFEATLSGSLSTTYNISTKTATGINPDGSLITVPNAGGFTNEPTGITYNANTGNYFISDDSAREVFEVDSVTMNVIRQFDTLATFGSNDPEGIAYDPAPANGGMLYVLDGHNEEVYKISPGANGIFDGVPPTGDDFVVNFDTTILGVADPEGITIDSDSGHLFIVGFPETDMVQVTTSGDPVRTIDISDALADKPAGLVHAPSSVNPAAMSVYISDRRNDNDSVLNENDGMVYEFSVPPITSGNTAPSVDAGSDQMITLPAVANLNGNVTDDGLPAPPTVATLWSQISGPGTVTFGNASLENTTASFSSAGSYLLRLTADDGELLSSDDLIVDVTGNGNQNVIEISISASSDDAEQLTSSMNLTSGDLDIGQRTVGMRFAGATIPKQATITNAFIQFSTDEVTTNATSVTINGEDIDDASTFISANPGNITDRPLTAASVAWSPSPWQTVGDATPNQRTPNIASVIQEIVDRTGWTSGNALAVIISTGTGLRKAGSFDGSQQGPLLHVEFTPPGDVPPTVEITSPSDNSIFVDTDSITFTATATDPEDGNVDASLVWASNLDGQIGTGPSFNISSLTIGTHTVTATAMDSVLQPGADQITVTVNPVGGPPETLDIPISLGSDDAEERNGSTMLLASADLELVDDGSRKQKVGLRFNGITIPQGRIITNAYIQFQADETDSGPISLTINGQAVDNATTFTSAPGNISSRALTTASVAWSPPNWTVVGEAGLNQRTSNIASVIQEIVNRPGWSSGNSLALIISGSGERTAEASEGALDPVLHIEYTNAGGNQPPNVTISQPSNNATFDENDSITFSATANDPEDGNVGASLVWTSSLDGQIGTGPSFSSTSLTTGTHTISAMAMDSVPQPGSDQITVTVNAAGGSPGVLDISVSSSSDDAEERNGSMMLLASADLELVDDGSRKQKVGLRFNGITIPQGATITNSYLQFQADEADSGSISLTINGEDVDNAATFNSTPGNISSRTLTTASVAWSPPNWTAVGEAGLNQRTSNIASVIQEIVNRPGWSSGNSLALIISGSGERTAESFNGSFAPQLHLEFTN